MSDPLVYLGTADGLLTYRIAGTDLSPVGDAIDGETVRTISVAPADPSHAIIGCGLRGWGLYRTRDAGRTTTSLGFDDEWVWGTAFHPTDPTTVYVGTEPPALYESDDGGRTFTEHPGIQAMASRDDWMFFHDPFHAGHLHGFATHADTPDRLFVGVEHGALLYTHDAGETWHERLTGHDLHRITIAPTDPDRVLAGAGEGLFVSDDAGDAWTRHDPLADEYVHSITTDPTDPDRLYLYAAGDGPTVYRSDDTGRSWTPLDPTLPPARPADPLTVLPDDTVLYAGDDATGSSLYRSPDHGRTWDRIATFKPKIWRVTTPA